MPLLGTNLMRRSWEAKMADDLLCSVCQHPLGLHSYHYGTCEHVTIGIYIPEKCGCTLTLHDLIQNLQAQDATKKLEEMRIKKQKYMDLLVEDYALLSKAHEVIDFLKSQSNSIKELLNEAKSVEPRSVYLGWFTNDYKIAMHKILDKAILELEKTNE